MTDPDARDPDIRRVVGELAEGAPPRPSWDEIEQRAARPDPTVVHLADAESARRRKLAIAASIAVVGAGAVALLVVGPDRGGDAEVADSPLPAPSSAPPSVSASTSTSEPPLTPVNPTPTTALPGDTPSTSASGSDETIAPSTTADPGPATTADPGPATTADPTPTTIGELGSTTTTSPTTTTPLPTTTAAAPGSPTELDTRPLAEVGRIPSGAWVASAAPPGGLVEAYTIDDGVRTTVGYADGGAALITVVAENLQFPGGDPITIAGRTWLRSGPPDGFFPFTTYVLEIGNSMVTVSSRGVDEPTTVQLIESLVAGPESIVTAPRLVEFGDGMDLVATGAGGTLSVSGNPGWYCYDLVTTMQSALGCGEGRGGEPASLALVLGGESGRIAAGIVDPGVATVEVAFADGTTRQTNTEDLSGRYDDRFFVVDVSAVGDVGPFDDPNPEFELRLLDAAGSLLGLAPLPPM